MPDLAASPLGVFDSGVGGLTVASALRSALPDEDLVYIGDTARVPYGSKPTEMVRSFALEIALELVERGVKGIVVACNTASAASLPWLADQVSVPVWGVIEPGVQAALRESRGGRVGVLGTQVTVSARAYQSRLEAAGLQTWAKACPLFVPIVEEGVSDSAIAELVARHYLAERPPLESVILGCTHYPALKATLQNVLGAEVRLLDSAEETAAVVARDLRHSGLAKAAKGGGSMLHLVTGDLASYVHTSKVLGGPEGEVERLSLPRRSRAPAYQE